MAIELVQTEEVVMRCQILTKDGWRLCSERRVAACETCGVVSAADVGRGAAEDWQLIKEFESDEDEGVEEQCGEEAA